MIDTGYSRLVNCRRGNTTPVFRGGQVLGVPDATGHAPLKVIDTIFGRCRPDSLIALGSERPGKRDPHPHPHYLYPVPVHRRNEMLPGIFQYHIEQTQYLYINTLHRAALLGRKVEAFERAMQTGEPAYFAALRKYLHELVGLLIDLDVGREPGDITGELALGVALAMARDGGLPWPSMAALSGRGAYLLWLLSDGTPQGRPPLYTTDTVRAWELCIKKLLKLPEQLKADPHSTAIAKWYKRPGTIDRKTGKEVVYMTFGVNGLTNVPRYTLDDLMQILDVAHATIETAAPERIIAPTPERIIAPAARRDVKKRKSRAGRGLEPLSLRYFEIEKISQHRGGIVKGQGRHHAIYFYYPAVLAALRNQYRGTGPRWYEQAAREAYRAAERLNAQFRPPLEPADLSKTSQPGKPVDGKLCFARGATIAAHLHVTEKEALDLGLQLIVPAALKAKRKADETARKAKRKKDRTEVQAAIDTALRAGRRDLTNIGRPHGKGRQYVYSRLQRLRDMPTPLLDGQQ